MSLLADDPRSTQKQVRFLMALLEDNGYSIQHVDPDLSRRFKLHESDLSTESWLFSLPRSTASRMIDALKEN